MLYFGANNTLYYPNAAMTIGSCRGHFRLQGIEADDLESSGVRECVMNYNENDETTGISILISQSSILNSEGWYDISGRKMINGK